MQLRQLSRLALALVVSGALVALVSSCGEEAREDCENFSTCADFYDSTFDTETTGLARYGPDGECWDDPLVAEACREQCRDTMRGYGTVLTEAGYDDEGACDVENN